MASRKLASDQFLEIDAGDSAALIAAARVAARDLAGAEVSEARLSLARAYCLRVVASWWQVLSASDTEFSLRPLLKPVDLAPLSEAVLLDAERVGRAVAHHPPENAAYEIGLIYTGMLPQAYRAERGAYYTPPLLAARLIAQASDAGVDWARARILDPACGGGAFLAPAARRIIDSLPEVSPRILVKNVANRLYGYELDPFAAWLSQVALDAVMLPICRRAAASLPVVVSICDSLQRPRPKERFDLVIGNPPYGRVRLSPRQRSRYRRSLYGHANLYGLFTDLALRHVKLGGVVAFVTPTSFLAGEYFKNLRALLGKEAPPVSIDFVAARKGVFDGVLQETLLAAYAWRPRTQAAQVHEVMPCRDDDLAVVETGSFTLPVDHSQPWLMPRSPRQAPLVRRLRSFSHRLSDWGYEVSTGPLVWNRHKSQLRGVKERGAYPLIWAEAVAADGRFVFRAEKRNHKPYFAPQSGDEWLVTRRACVLLQRTTAKEQNRRLIAAALPDEFLEEHGAVVIENHLNMLRPAVEKPPVAPAALSAFLNSGSADRAFRCVSGSVAVSAYELQALPLPAPDSLTGLADLIHNGASGDLIEAECERLFEVGDSG